MADETESQEDDAPETEAPETEAEGRQKQAIEKLLGVFDEIEQLGVPREKMVIVALSATLNQMVAVFGEEKAAAVVQTVPEKILSGHFTTKPGGTVQ